MMCVESDVVTPKPGRTRPVVADSTLEDEKGESTSGDEDVFGRSLRRPSERRRSDRLRRSSLAMRYESGGGNDSDAEFYRRRTPRPSRTNMRYNLRSRSRRSSLAPTSVVERAAPYRFRRRHPPRGDGLVSWSSVDMKRLTRRVDSEESSDSSTEASGDESPSASMPSSNTQTKGKKPNANSNFEPISIPEVGFDEIAGFDEYLHRLKEMIIFPLLFPGHFARLGIRPPTGVLFHGPPGTGKTLLARILASACSTPDRRVTFFLRNGAECLSKWIGEAEANLARLFKAAKEAAPAIIFFDEIDGMAPDRGARQQDQSHISLLSSLLALMDGLEGRGEGVVVIGATNRIEALDPALRRPGRFDREFFFGLPHCDARQRILEIHTRQWSPQPDKATLAIVARETEGFSGAQLKGLVGEAAMLAFRRACPLLYETPEEHPNALLARIQETGFAPPSQVPVTLDDFCTAFHLVDRRTGETGEGLKGDGVYGLFKVSLASASASISATFFRSTASGSSMWARGRAKVHLSKPVVFLDAPGLRAKDAAALTSALCTSIEGVTLHTVPLSADALPWPSDQRFADASKLHALVVAPLLVGKCDSDALRLFLSAFAEQDRVLLLLSGDHDAMEWDDIDMDAVLRLQLPCPSLDDASDFFADLICVDDEATSAGEATPSPADSLADSIDNLTRMMGLQQSHLDRLFTALPSRLAEHLVGAGTARWPALAFALHRQVQLVLRPVSMVSRSKQDIYDALDRLISV